MAAKETRRSLATTICRDGWYYIRYTTSAGRRRKFALGTQSPNEAKRTCNNVCELLLVRQTGQPLPKLLHEWVEYVIEHDSKLAEQLVKHDIVDVVRVEQSEHTLGQLLATFFEARKSEVKASTYVAWQHTKRNLLQHFGPDRKLITITTGDALAFKRFLATLEPQTKTRTGNLSKHTVRKRCSNARQIFEFAVEYEWIARNPFRNKKIPTAVGGNKDLEYFVSENEAISVMNACPDIEWKTMWALARWGGLRCPSETSAVRIVDIDWNSEEVTFRSPKTEHHEGKESRTIPLFPELQHVIRDCIEQAPDGAVYLLHRLRGHTNPAVQFKRFVKSAGLKPWPKLLQNLRSTRETELIDQGLPIHVVCAWIGNSPQVAMRHYLQMTEAHKRQALEMRDADEFAAMVSNGTRFGTKNGTKNPDEKRGAEKDPAFSSHSDASGRNELQPSGRNWT